jgi:uncharacterized protein DUF4390
MRATLAFLGLLLFVAGAGVAASLSEFKATVDGDRVLASVALDGAFDRRLSERMDSGLPTAILYRFELHRDRKRWYDHRLRSASLEVVAMYDAVERSYSVHWKLDGKLIESRTVRDKKALEAAMTRVAPLPVFDLKGLPPRQRLLLKARAELGTKTILSFIPVTLTTDWVDSPKFRVPSP